MRGFWCGPGTILLEPVEVPVGQTLDDGPHEPLEHVPDVDLRVLPNADVEPLEEHAAVHNHAPDHDFRTSLDTASLVNLWVLALEDPHSLILPIRTGVEKEDLLISPNHSVWKRF